MYYCYANPGSVHSAAAPCRRILRESRKKMADLLGFRDSSVYFTSGGTEANNTAVCSGAYVTGRKQIIVSAQEHSSVLYPALSLRDAGFAVDLVYPDSFGRINPGDVASLAGRNTALICIQAANNETGVIQDIEAFAAIARDVGALYLCDAVQSFCHADMALNCADMVTLSAHKFGGPRGVGCLALREGLRLRPLIYGGGQEFGLRSGTENVPGIAGMSLAAQLACSELKNEDKRQRELIGLLISLISRKIPELRINSGDARRLPGIVNLGFPGISGEEMLTRLDSAGICVSAGSACAAGDRDPSHVLLSMGQSRAEAGEAVRISVGRMTSEAEIYTAAGEIVNIVQKKQTE